ncbi:MAG: hypothetical protein JWP27_3060 [Flaviaesturariibacter sp.]|nr:hypothetical protein [Flaviaesturariibacter sp.]
MAVNKASAVKALIQEVKAGLDPAEAGKRLRTMGLPPVERASVEDNLRQETLSYTPGSITEVALARARGDLTAEQEKGILDAFVASR